MPNLTVNTKGQITLRQELLQHLGIRPGQQVTVDKLPHGVLALHTKPAHGLEAFVGCLPPPVHALSLDQMNALVAEAWESRPG
jgi:antitoxin PrlF